MDRDTTLEIESHGPEELKTHRRPPGIDRILTTRPTMLSWWCKKCKMKAASRWAGRPDTITHILPLSENTNVNLGAWGWHHEFYYYLGGLYHLE